MVETPFLSRFKRHLSSKLKIEGTSVVELQIHDSRAINIIKKSSWDSMRKKCDAKAQHLVVEECPSHVFPMCLAIRCLGEGPE